MVDVKIEKIGHWLGSGTVAAWIVAGALAATPFVLVFVISRLLLRRLMKGDRAISAAFSPSAASALLAVTGGQLFYWVVIVLASLPSDSLGLAMLAGAVLFVPLFALAIPVTLLYFCLALRKKNVADGALIWLVAGFLLTIEIVYLYELLDGLE